MTNPFDRPDCDYLVLVDDRRQHSLWPSALDVPAGWTVAFGPAGRPDCLEFTATARPDPRPASACPVGHRPARPAPVSPDASGPQAAARHESIRRSDSIMTASTSTVSAPPTMAGHPLFGSLMDLQRDTLGTYLKALRDHGDVVRFTVGPPGMRAEFYGVFSADGAQQVLASSAQTFSKENRFLGELRQSFGNGLLTSMGDEYLRQRRMLQSLFTPRQVSNYGSEITQETGSLVERWRTAPDATVDVAEEMTGHTLRTISRILFGRKNDVDAMVPTVQRNFPRINAYAVKRAFAPVNLSRKMPTPGNLRAAKAHRELYEVCDEIISAR
ncbi:cytochrome P450, partial [Streptomyces bobili]|uniref:cytochrome P450 n=1 Tax=Streptomyces bobili TaxID=67280 RepID=UPI00117F5B5B